jgi:hypothetical protein
VNWFGEPWPDEKHRAPVCEDDALQVPPPPPGELCVMCGNRFAAGDRGILMPHVNSSRMVSMRYMHLDCLLGNVGVS